MVLRLLLPAFLILQINFLQAQQSSSKAKFTSVNQLGLLTGATDEALLIQTINGVKKDKWFAGIGVGIDYYKERTIPLFLDIRRDFSRRKNTPFAYADGGVNFSWLKNNQKGMWFNSLDYSSSPGVCYDLGVGWKLTGQNNRGFIFSAGYSFKQIKETIKLRWGAPTPQLQEQNNERYNYLYRRVVVKVGFML